MSHLSHLAALSRGHTGVESVTHVGYGGEHAREFQAAGDGDGVGGRPWFTIGDGWLPSRLRIASMTRISGTATDGVWQGSVRVSSAYIGRWFGHLSDIEDVNGNSSFNEVPTNEFQIGAPVGSCPGRRCEPIPLSGWSTGRGSGRLGSSSSTGLRARRFPVPSSTASVPVGTSTCLLSAPPVPAFERMLPACGRALQQRFTGGTCPSTCWPWRGTSGFSLEGRGCYSGPTVKWQANERFSVSGRTITASGNAFPAPKIHHAHNPSIRLQYLVGRTWRQAARSTVHPSGRYSISCTVPQAGVVAVRVVKPGGVGECESSVGLCSPRRKPPPPGRPCHAQVTGE